MFLNAKGRKVERRGTQRFAFFTLLYSLPQVLILGNFSSLAHRVCPSGTRLVTINRGKSDCVLIGSIGDTVFNDINGNHHQDPNEPGISGVTVYLKDSHGNLVSTTTTDSNGKYRFPSLLAGQYTVTIPHPPDRFTLTQTQSHPIHLGVGQNFEHADFGFRPPANALIGDTVFRDQNGNGIQDNHEPGIPHIKVTLRLPDGSTRTTTTDGHGRYSFTHLPPGSYQVTSDVPQNHVLTTNANPLHIDLVPSQKFDHADFGFHEDSSIGRNSIGDTVFSDRNGNGIQDAGEPGIPNVLLTLTLPGVDGILGNDDDTNQTTTTNGNGIYNFDNLLVGNYRVTVNPPDNFPRVTTGSPQVDVNIPPGQSLTNVDFGLTASNLGASGNKLVLVKRITAVLRTNGQRLQYDTFIDDPNDQDDNELRPLTLGEYELLTPLVSGDEVEYTIYFRAGESLENLNLCDLIPVGTAYVTNSIAVTGSGFGADQGRFFSPLTSLEQIPESRVCENQNNANGTVIVKLGNISSGQSGTVRFWVKIN
ncbi:MAG: carboxypeptidase regulatory-like domain-containing protein [Goleter apudmare HA4340-LM2]|jgi:uncharacterized repeat protein (TIGR01451 family)|nr:carboxypeptidase regulatory-like domain-containing protein [Goleter apudmare HA4340-LM2]